MFALWINDRPLDDLVRQVLSFDGYLAPVVATAPALELANSAAVFGTATTVPPRTLTIGCDVRPASFVDRQAVMDGLKRRLLGLLEIRTGDLEDRVLRGVLRQVRVEFYGGAHAQLPIYLELEILCADPARFDQEPTLRALSTSRTVCPVGTEPSAPIVWICGACTNPEVVVRAHTGTEVSRLTFTVTLASTDYLVIDASQQTVDRYVAGVRQTGAAAGLASLSSGRFPILFPADAGATPLAGPTLELTSSAGTATGLVSYLRRW